jgi:beta-glucosidase
VADLAVTGPVGADRSLTPTFGATNLRWSAGAEVVPVFVHRTSTPIVVPPHWLVGFARLELEPGESRTVDITFPLSRLSVTPGDIDGSAPPEVEPGVYTVEIPIQPQPNDLFPTSSPPLQAEFTVS